MQMLCWPVRSPFKASSRFPDGTLRSLSRTVISNRRRLRRATVAMPANRLFTHIPRLPRERENVPLDSLRKLLPLRQPIFLLTRCLRLPQLSRKGRITRVEVTKGVGNRFSGALEPSAWPSSIPSQSASDLKASRGHRVGQHLCTGDVIFTQWQPSHTPVQHIVGQCARSTTWTTRHAPSSTEHDASPPRNVSSPFSATLHSAPWA